MLATLLIPPIPSYPAASRIRKAQNPIRLSRVCSPTYPLVQDISSHPARTIIDSLCNILCTQPPAHLHDTAAIAAAPDRCNPQSLSGQHANRRRHTTSAMAYDTYRGHADAHQASYPPTYDHSHAPSSYDYDSQYRTSTHDKSRTSSSVASDRLPPPSQQPLKNAIGNAFEKSDAARVVDPNLIAQITEQVKKSVLEEIKLSVAASATQAQPVHVTPHYVPPSPNSTTESIPPRDIYTPPSPKHTEFSSRASPSPDPLTRDPLLDGNHDTPTPRHPRGAPVEIPNELPSARPAPAARMATDDYTPIEKMWQRLFDPDGQPLPRLGEFLRGLALHLVSYAFL